MKKVISIAAISATLLLTGCSQVSSAASVGSVKISQATVQSSINDIMSERSKVDSSQMQLEVGEDLNRSQMRFHVLSQLLNKVAEKLDFSVTKAEIDTRRASITEQVGGEAGLPTALVGAGIAAKDFAHELAWVVAVIGPREISKAPVRASLLSKTLALKEIH